MQKFQMTAKKHGRCVHAGEMRGRAHTKAVASMQAKMHATVKPPDTPLQPPAQLGSPRQSMSSEIIVILCHV